MAQLNNSFSEIAHIYHRFNNNQMYDQWLAFTLRHLPDYPSKMVDLACGNGEFTARMADFVDQIIGIDYDPAMIQEAKAKNAPGPHIHYKVGNMLEASNFAAQVDLVTCYLDAFCFLTSREDLLQSFAEVNALLKPGGIFLFDVWSISQLKDFDGYYYYDLDDQAALLWESHSIEAISHLGESIRHDITVFESQANSQLYRRIQTSLIETTYPIQTYYDLLIKAGFDRKMIRLYPDFAHEAVDGGEDLVSESNVERWFFKVVK